MSSSQILILAVDDEPDLCALTKDFLEMHGGVDVDTAHSVRDARIALLEKRYDAIVSDYQMPGEDGIQFLKSLRSKGDRIPFILFTGKGREEVVIEALNSGADSYLQKGGMTMPLYTELEHRIRSAVRRHEADRALEQRNIELLKANEELAFAEQEMASQLEEIRSGHEEMAAAEDDLRESEERHRSLFENMLNGAAIHEIICNAEGVPIDYRFLAMNLAFERMTGLSKDGILRKTVREVMPNIEPIWIERYGRVALTGVSDHFESSVKDLGRHYEVSVYRNAHRQFTTIFHEVTERKRAEMELATAQTGLREAHRLTHIGTWDWVIETDEVTWSEELYRIAGRDHSLPAPTFAEQHLQYTPASWENLSHAVQATLTTGEPYNLELDMVRPDDSIRMVNAIGSVKRSEEGNVTGLHGIVQDITERRRAEDMLREGEALYRSVVNASPDDITIADLEGSITMVSPKGVTMFGYNGEQEILGRSIIEFIIPEERERAKANVLTLFQGTFKGSKEYHGLRSDGSVFDIEVNAEIIQDTENLPGRLIFIIRDITERKLAEKALRESEIRYRLLVESASEAIVVAQDGMLRFVNLATVEMTGISEDELLSVPFISRIHPDDRAMVGERYLKRSRGEPVPNRYIFRLLTGEGTTRWAEMNAVIIEWEGRLATLNFLTDITERKRLEGELKESEEFYRQLTSNISVGVIIIDPLTRTIESVNEAAATMFGSAKESIVGHRCHSFLCPALEDACPICDLGQNVDDSEKVMICANGRRRPILKTVKRISIRGREKLLECFVDISDRKRAEDALLMANRKLNLLSSITRHDINNQTTALKGHLALLEKKQPEIASNEHLKKAEKAAEQISAMVEFTKEYEDIGVNAPTWQNIRALLASCVKDIPLGAVKFINDVPIGTEIFADSLIIKVFHNLVHNAVRHGGDTTTIILSLEEQDGTRAIICEDDGVGIPADMKEKLFTQGFGKDHGLGLFLSREILAITGISITEEGVQGKGAKFVMTVPTGGLRTT